MNRTYATPDRQIFVSLSERVRIVHDPARAGLRWNLLASVFFLQGSRMPGSSC